jgi:hypothetical protein
MTPPSPSCAAKRSSGVRQKENAEMKIEERITKSRERWVRRTRESVARYLMRYVGPFCAQEIEGNLDLTQYSALGFLDQRSSREISAALRWLVEQGYAEEVEIEPWQLSEIEHPDAKHYQLTQAGFEFAQRVSEEPTARSAR